jgi:serine phosphatase RsbU (regulator of sigma subunit)
VLRKLLIVSLACAVVGGSALLLYQRVTTWDHIGWAGLAYQPKVSLTGGPATSAATLPRADFRVQAVAPHSPAMRAGIREGDAIRAIDGIPPSDVERLKRHAASLGSGDTISYTIERGGEVTEVRVTLVEPFRTAPVLAATATSVFVGLAFLLISLTVAWNRPSSRAAMVFFLMSLSGAVLFLLWAAGDLDYLNLRGVLPTYEAQGLLVVLGVAVVLSLFLSNLLLHFALVFPRARPVLERGPGVLVWLHTVPFFPFLAILAAVAGGAAGTRVGAAVPGTVAGVALAVGLLLLALRGRSRGWRGTLARSPLTLEGAALASAALVGLAARGAPSPTLFRAGVAVGVAALVWLLLVVVAYSILTCIALYRSYREAGVEEKHQVRWPLWGTLVSVLGSVLVTGAVLLVSWLAPAGGTSQLAARAAGVAVSKLLYLLIPVSFAFGILKYRLMDIDVVIRKTVRYSAVTAFVVVSFLVLAATLGLALVRYAGVESPTAAVFVTLLAVAVVIPLRARVQAFVDARLGGRGRDLEASLGRLRQAAAQDVAPDAFLAVLVDEVQQALQCRTVAALRPGTGSATLAAVATVGIRDALLSNLRVPTDTPLLRGPSAVVPLAPETLDEAARRTVTAAGAVLAVPVQRGGDSGNALLLVGPKLSREPYDEAETDYLAAAAETALLALARAEGKRAEVEFSQARTIQESLLPSTLPAIPGVELAAHWKPAREVGGDYFDAFALSSHGLGVCIADVSGKGVAAALLMSNLQALLRAAATAGASPEEVCTRVRAGLLRSLAGGRFVTLFYGVLDAQEGSLVFCNAGHNPPLLARRHGAPEWLPVTGPALARVLAEAPFRRSGVRLEAGDRLVLFTDGVTEALSPEGAGFGEKRLVDVLERTAGADAETSRRAITEAVIAFAGAEPQDDLTVLVARFTA